MAQATYNALAESESIFGLCLLSAAMAPVAEAYVDIQALKISLSLSLSLSLTLTLTLTLALTLTLMSYGGNPLQPGSIPPNGDYI